MRMSNQKEHYFPDEIFEECGPFHLKNVYWSERDHRRTVAASIVKGMYVLERDHQLKREGHKALAPFWWEYFHFQKIQDIIDLYDDSIYGAILEYKPHDKNQHQNIPPKYVIAFRGTFQTWGTIQRDLFLDAKLLLNIKTRYQPSLQAVQSIIHKKGVRPENVWLAGHSLGAAIALQTGKTMAKQGYYIETYLFNPPNCSAPIEKLVNNRYLKTGIRAGRSLVTLGVSSILNVASATQDDDPFNMLRSWKPYLFVNQNDWICCEYIGYFEHRERMESKGLGWVQRKIAKKSVISVVKGACGRDDEALHQVPSALIVNNDQVKGSHALRQWWSSHLNLQYKLYQF